MLNERPALLSFLSGGAHQRHALLALWREKWFPANSASIYLWLTRPTLCTHTSARSHICTAHARTCTYCTHAGFALIPDCFGFCGGLIRLLFKLCAKPVCLSELVCVCRSVMMFPQPVVGIAQFQLLLIALCSTGLILSPVSCLTPVFHYYPTPVQEDLRYPS